MTNLKPWEIEALKEIAEDLEYMDPELSRDGVRAALVLALVDLKEELRQIKLELRREK